MMSDRPCRQWRCALLLAVGLTLLAAPVLAQSNLAELEKRVAALEDATTFNLGGALRVNYGYTDWSKSSQDKEGDFAFDLFRLNVDGSYDDLFLSAEYRFYPQYNFDTVHHGYIGYNFSDDLQGQLGIHQVPFGILPYASHNFWFSGAYYIGFEDDYDMGLKFDYTPGPWSFTAAFYKNAELGNASDTERYSTDLVTDGTGQNEEINQGNLRLAYTFDHGDRGSTELGLSGELGQTYNATTAHTGDRWAAAAHLVGNYGNLNLQLEYAAYEYDLADPFDPNLIRVGGYGYSWDAPAEATFAIANIAYTVPVKAGPIDSITFYSDNTLIDPKEKAFENAWQNVVGALIASGKVYTYVDVISGENMIFMGSNPTAPDDKRHTRVNVNFGYYF